MNKFEFYNENDAFGVTSIENIFINHYMPEARGSFVKVYIYCLKLSLNNEELDIKSISKNIGESEKDVEAALQYWEKQGIIKPETEPLSKIKTYRFYNINANMLNPKIKENLKINSKLDDLLLELEKKFKRPLTTSERHLVNSWLRDFDFTPTAAAALIEYCLDELKQGSYNYWYTVANDWHNEGLRTYDQFKKHISKRKNYNYIMSYLGFSRNPSTPEKEIMDKWYDKYELKTEQILKACDETSKIKEPNFAYIDAVITDWYTDEKPKRKKETAKSKVTKIESDNSYYNEDDVEKALFGE